MKITSNFLRMYRKQQSVTLHDIAYLLNVDVSNVTRYEKGNRQPTPEVLLTYHLLFNVNIIDVFHEQFKHLCKKLHHRSLSLIEQLKEERPPRSELRIKYLRNLITRLNNSKNECQN